MIVPYCHDLTGNPGAEYRVFTDGPPGAQVCTIQFKNLTEKTTVPAMQYSNINFQIKLYETTNVIEFIYGPFTASANATAFKTAVRAQGNIQRPRRTRKHYQGLYPDLGSCIDPER